MNGSEELKFLPSRSSESREENITKTKNKKKLRRKWLFVGFIAHGILTCSLLAILIAILSQWQPKPTTTKLSIRTGAVVSNNEICSKIGRDILDEGGSAVDSTIATLLCVGVMSPDLMGIGGGCFMVIYDAVNNKSISIDGRETAPLGSTDEVIFKENSYFGAKMIGIPGEVATYWKAHKMYGKLPWKRLFDPSVKIMEHGFYASKTLVENIYNFLRYFNQDVCDYEGLRMFCNLTEGAVLKMPKLAKTYRQISLSGPDFLYKGDSARISADEIQRNGGLVTKEDLESYAVKVTDGLHFDLGETILYTSGLPSGGAVMGFALNILKGMGITPASLNNATTHAFALHKIVEAIKFAYGLRAHLGDQDFEPEVKQILRRMISDDYAKKTRERIDLKRTHDIDYYTDVSEPPRDHGTSHVCVLGPDGDAVSVTSSLNLYFGSLTASESTGIIWNNVMADFTPATSMIKSPNTLKPGKRPLSSMAPAIFVDKQTRKVTLVLGSAGSMKITPTNIQIAARHILFGQDIEDSIRSKRFHHQLNPNVLMVDPGFPEDVLYELEKYGHVIETSDGISYAQGISRNKQTDFIEGSSDQKQSSGRAMYSTKEVEQILK